MEVQILDTSFRMAGIVDSFDSLIWSDRHRLYGDFEIYGSAASLLPLGIQNGFYLTNFESEHTMIVEGIVADSDAEDGSVVTISGRSLESILERRVIWPQTILSGNLQDGIEKLLNDAIISPSTASRKIDNFIFKRSDDPTIVNLKIEAQFTGDNLYEAISNICAVYDLGFKVVLNEKNQFVFSLYKGKDRSYSQQSNPYVIFSSDFDNLLDSNYISSIQAWKNAAIVAGEGEDNARKHSTFDLGYTGLNRRELFVDARDISSATDAGTLSNADYKELLNERGAEQMLEHPPIESFEASTDNTGPFIYGRDFFMGDIIQIHNEYGLEASAQVIEVVRSQDSSGEHVVPTFSTPNLS